ncbi:transcriptional regulator [Conyzicola sp.]|uniref:transcriptional regulator n=1 Tax=Conyzicola sp. TaxID=1969404 RepID=UPI00398A00B3
MTAPWSTEPFDRSTREHLAQAHDAVVGARTAVSDVRRIVHDSWLRSLDLAIDPDHPVVRLDLDVDELRDYRDAHPLSLALPTIRRLLVRHTLDAGLIVAVGDQAGRLLWIDGDRALRRRAEGMLFVEGADWSERAVGTSAPGTALALDHGVQIQGAEHFARLVHPWSCSAVPVHDPESGAVIGVIDITGGENAIATATLPLLEAAVAAVEAQLRLDRLDSGARTPRRARPAESPALPVLKVLGSDVGRLEAAGRVVDLTTRHAEILALLAWHPEGLSAEHLATLVYGRDDAVVTLRSEMVRLRRVLETVDPGLVPVSRPYRLQRRLDLDATRCLAFLDRGAHRVALGAYAGPVLPGSRAPGIRSIRTEVSARLREALLTDAAADTLLAYARTDEAAFDAEVWRACLRLLPPRSPRRASVVARLEQIERELAQPFAT